MRSTIIPDIQTILVRPIASNPSTTTIEWQKLQVAHCMQMIMSKYHNTLHHVCLWLIDGIKQCTCTYYTEWTSTMHMYLLHRLNFKVKLINCRLPQRMPWYVHNVSVKNEMVIHLCPCQIAYFEFNDVITCLCIVEIVFWLMPENGGGWGAEGRARNGSRHLHVQKLAWNRGLGVVYLAFYYYGLKLPRNPSIAIKAHFGDAWAYTTTLIQKSAWSLPSGWPYTCV